MIRRLAVVLALAVAQIAYSQVPGVPTTTTGVSSAPRSEFGQPVTFTATVAPPVGVATVPTGTVAFLINGQIPLGNATLDPTGVAALTVSTLAASDYSIVAAYGGDATFAGSAGSIPQLVTAAQTFLTWVPNPSTIVVNTPLGTGQLNATAASKYVASVPGTFTYTPAAGTSFASPGAQTLNVQFAPTDTADFLVTSGSVQINVVNLLLTAINPNTANLGDGPTTVTFTGGGFGTSSVAQVNGTAIPTTFVNATTLTGVIPATAFTQVGALQLTVFDSRLQETTAAISLNVVAPPAQVVLTGPSTSPPGTQPSLTFQLTNPYPVPLNGVFTLAFTPNSPTLSDDPAIQFATGGRTLPFSVAANSVATPAVQFQDGTVAGTITITLTLTAGGANVTPTSLQPVVIQVPPAAPTVSSLAIQRNGMQLVVTLHGFSNTREIVAANFHFNPASGSITNPDVAVPVTTLFSQWFGSEQSTQFGSTFTYTQTFTLNHDADTIKSVSVTLVNSIGTSTEGSAQ